ncbi:MAG: MarR family winged helix-turn-helix transcriptional regulator [Terriglobales bacterium]
MSFTKCLTTFWKILVIPPGWIAPGFIITFMDERLPLPSLLSQALVAFTIEFDNEAERILPHRTTRHGSTSGLARGPWLVSQVMWSNCMRFVSEEGITVRELERVARTKTNLNGMTRWGYITIKPDPTDSRPKPPRSGWLIRATAAGRKAQEIWQPLFGVIEKRWQERFGRDEIDHLRKALARLVGQIEIELPDCLPILGYGLFSSAPSPQRPAPGDSVADTSELPLSALLSKALLAFAIEFERDSEVSLAIGANVLRLAGTEGVRVRDLPRRAGVSKEAIATSLSFLVKRGYAIVKPESPSSRVKTLVLTPKGRDAQEIYLRRLGAIEKDWRARFGDDTIRTLREVLERLAGPPGERTPPLFRGLEPHADGWRASVPRPEHLPHYPMVLHRGGFPDGS